jgi:hypothetical protein
MNRSESNGIDLFECVLYFNLAVNLIGLLAFVFLWILGNQP